MGNLCVGGNVIERTVSSPDRDEPPNIRPAEREHIDAINTCMGEISFNFSALDSLFSRHARNSINETIVNMHREAAELQGRFNELRNRAHVILPQLESGQVASFNRGEPIALRVDAIALNAELVDLGNRYHAEREFDRPALTRLPSFIHQGLDGIEIDPR